MINLFKVAQQMKTLVGDMAVHQIWELFEIEALDVVLNDWAGKVRMWYDWEKIVRVLELTPLLMEIVIMVQTE